jgi:transposase InsO family protein
MAQQVTAMDIKMLVATLPQEADISAWCRQLGISRQTAYKWRRRFRTEGLSGLEDRSRAPREPHGRTASNVEDLAVAIRKQLVEAGLDHGPASVNDRLADEHGIRLADATVWRILSRRGQVNPQPKKRPRSSWQRFARERPNECWQGDDTHYFLASGQEVRIINMLDDHSRLNVESLAVIQCRSPRIWEAFCRATERYGIPAEFLNDNGRAWRSEDGFAPTVFQANLGRVGVHQIHSSAYHPQTCGKVERFHQTQRRWLSARPIGRTVTELQLLLDEFRDIYNHQRRHRGIGRRTPFTVWSAQPPARPAQAAADPDTVIATCRVAPDGRITPGSRLRIGVGREWSGHDVAVIRRGDHATVVSLATGEIIRDLDIDPNRYYQGTGRPRGGGPKPKHRLPDQNPASDSDTKALHGDLSHASNPAGIKPFTNHQPKQPTGLQDNTTTGNV